MSDARDASPVEHTRYSRRTLRSDGSPHTIRLTRCPACGTSIPDGHSTVSSHLRSHGPADFGLSPLEEGDDDE